MPCKRVAFHIALVAALTLAASVPSLAAVHKKRRAPQAEPPSEKAPAEAPAGVEVDRVEGQIIYFRSPKGVPTPPALKAELYELKYLGAIRSADPAVPPYFLFSGKPCANCLEDTGIYALPPAGGRPDAFVYPGKILEPKTRALLLESRSFWGRCLRGRGDVYVTFQKERIDRHRGMQPSVEVAEPGPQHLEDQLIERHVPRLADTLARVRRHQCFEIDGRNRLMLSKPLNRSRRAEDELKSEEQDDTPKENQTDEDLPPSE